MVKLLVLSDLHLEFCAFEPDPAAVSAADIVVLAGDIHPGADGILWARATFAGKPIVYVAGNHEFYDGDWIETLALLRRTAREHDVHFLENDAVDIAGLRFLGCTLWTDFAYLGEHRQEEAMFEAERGLADYRVIGVAGPDQRLSARLSMERHLASRAWLTTELMRGDPRRTVVVTHHYPHRRSTAPQFASDVLTPAFGSHLPVELLLRASLWIHGHTHSSCAYRLGDSRRSVRVVCNPRGYPYAWLSDEMENAEFNPGLLVSAGVPTIP
ncbi:MAG: metallophosphoesterase [Rhodoferax sp.]|nr:metallophosphoesterase [Rhodoferax sp.]